MTFFDAFLTLGRTNRAIPECPVTEQQLLALMDRYDVDEGLVLHTVARDCDPNLGNAELGTIRSPRLHKVWGFDPAYAAEESAEEFLARALRGGAKAIMVNPLMRGIRVDRSPRLLELGALLCERRIPLLAVYRQWDPGPDTVAWYELADYCACFPDLPVICWDWRTRANRPMFDALATAANLHVSLSAVWQAQMLEAVCASLGPARLVFSMGLPSLDPGSFQAVVAYADVDASTKEAIAGGTMRRILEDARYA